MSGLHLSSFLLLALSRSFKRLNKSGQGRGDGLAQLKQKIVFFRQMVVVGWGDVPA